MKKMNEPVYRFNNEALDCLIENMENNPECYRNPNTDFTALLKNKLGENYRTPVNGVHMIKELNIVPTKSKKTHLSDKQALDFYKSFEGMTPRVASDWRIFAYLNHCHLHRYGITRWPLPKTGDIKRHIQLHWFSNKIFRDIYERSISGRMWWIAHVAIRVAANSGGAFSEIQALEKFTEMADSYHRTMQFAVLRNPVLRAECIRALLNEAQGITREGYRKILGDLNREGGARLLDSLGRPIMRNLVLETTNQQMSTPKYVQDRKNLKNKKKLKVLSLGAGAQSTALALMAEEGWEGLEKPDFAIFADTHWEPPNVYEHLDWLEKQISYDVIRVSAGDIRENIMKGENSTGQKFLDVPVFLINKNGTESVAARQCTAHYKIKPIVKEIRQRLQVPAGKRVPKNIEVEMWMGISTDESIRMKPNRYNWITNRYPLIEMGMSRANIYNWFYDRYPKRHLPRSACIGCPYHSDMEWKWMKEHNPESFQDAVLIDNSLRTIPIVKGTIKGTAFLHHKRIPLDKVNFNDTEDYDNFMTTECEGLCGV